MKEKHIAIRIEQCLTLAKASSCPRRQFGALLLDPVRNVILMDGYNGGPRDAKGSLCRSWFCERDGLNAEDFSYTEGWAWPREANNRKTQIRVLHILYKGEKVTYVPYDLMDDPGWRRMAPNHVGIEERAKLWVAAQVKKYPPIPSGVSLERGCHHAEFNVICNAAANGVKTEGAWLIVTGEPCLMCAKAIHHAGIAKVLCVKGGYAGGDSGPEYLKEHNIPVQYVDGPQDPRASEKSTP